MTTHYRHGVRVLIDRNGMQAKVHADDGARLRDLVTPCGDAGVITKFSEGDALTMTELSNWDAVLITTRSPSFKLGWAPFEMEAGAQFVSEGGGLVLMTNHGDLPGGMPDHSADDALLARQFGIDIDCSVFRDGPRYEVESPQGRDGTRPTRRAGLPGEVPSSSAPNPALKALTLISEVVPAHPIVFGGERLVSSIVTNNCAGLRSPHADVVVRLPSTMRDARGDLPASERSFALSLDGTKNSEVVGSGRVVVIADSGFIGSEGSSFPGPGLIHLCDNTRFALSCIIWAAAG